MLTVVNIHTLPAPAVVKKVKSHGREAGIEYCNYNIKRD